VQTRLDKLNKRETSSFECLIIGDKVIDWIAFGLRLMKAQVRLLVIACSVLLTQAPAVAQSWSQFKQAGMWQQAWDVVKRSGGSDPRYYETLRGLTTVYIEEGRLADAEALLKPLASLPPETLQADENAWLCLSEYAKLLDKQGRADDATKMKALLPARKFTLSAQAEGAVVENATSLSFGTKAAAADADTNDLNGFLERGKKALAAQKYQMADRELRQALALAADAPATLRISILNQLITIAYQMHDLGSAEQFWRQVLPLAEKHYGANDRNFAISLFNYGALLRKMNRRQDAMKYEYKADLIVAATKDAEIESRNIPSSGFHWGSGRTMSFNTGGGHGTISSGADYGSYTGGGGGGGG
jgi:hypothetical protein